MLIFWVGRFRELLMERVTLLRMNKISVNRPWPNKTSIPKHLATNWTETLFKNSFASFVACIMKHFVHKRTCFRGHLADIFMFICHTRSGSTPGWERCQKRLKPGAQSCLSCSHQYLDLMGTFSNWPELNLIADFVIFFRTRWSTRN